MIRYCEHGHPPVRLVSGTRCQACARKREARRATPAQRGYGSEHRTARAMLAATLPSVCGYARDAQCPRSLILPGSRWVAAHVVDGDPSAGWMVSHPACNERAKVRGVSESGRTRPAIPAPRRQRLGARLDSFARAGDS